MPPLDPRHTMESDKQDDFSQEDAQEDGRRKRGKKKRGAIRSGLREAGVLGGIRSLAANSKEGGETVALGVKSIASATMRALEPGRMESFEQALKRLGVVDRDLPIIHNQIVFQCYITLAVAAVALSSALVFSFSGNFIAPVVAFLIFLTCIIKSAQSSIQCLSIRMRRLGINSIWLNSPSEWIPRRIHIDIPMDKNDPLRSPEIVSGLAKSSRKSFAVGASMLGLSVAWGFLFPGNQWSLLYVGVAMVMFFFGARDSFEVYKRLNAIHCDVLPWLSDPSAWIPDSSVEKADKARASRRGEKGESVIASPEADHAKE